MKTFRFLLFLGSLLLTTPTIYAQDYLAKAKEFLEQGDCERARLAYEDYKRYVNPQGNAEVKRRIEECGKVKLPTLTDFQFSLTTPFDAKCSYKVFSDKSAPVTVRGVCWGTSHQPSVRDNHTGEVGGNGKYISQISGLKAGTTYYVRVYATNKAGTAYSEEVSFATPSFRLPQVKTDAGSDKVTNVNIISAFCGGAVISDGGAFVTACGVCWSLSPHPTVQDNHTRDSCDRGTFSSEISGLMMDTIYYVRAYATNIVGTAYGDDIVLSTKYIPRIENDNVNEYSYSFDVINIEHWAQSGSFEACGVCWSPDPQPTFDDMKSVAQKNVMKLVKTKKGRVRGETKKVRVRGEISGLKACSTYYARAFVVYSEGIVYGEEKSFTTFCCGTSTVKDYDDNTYNTVKIGKQCWMKQNLRTTHYADGTLIRQGVDTSSTIAYWYYPDNNSANKGTYGLLYNWKAVMRNASSSSSNPSGVQGVCPRGWHVPSDGEWTQLTGYVGSNSSYCCSSNSGYVAKSLASKTGWKESNNACSVGNMSDSNNLTGFSAFPAGYYIDEYDCFGYCTYFWSATERVSDTSCAYFRRLKYNESNVDNLYRKKYFGFSVRCLRD